MICLFVITKRKIKNYLEVTMYNVLLMTILNGRHNLHTCITKLLI